MFRDASCAKVWDAFASRHADRPDKRSTSTWNASLIAFADSPPLAISARLLTSNSGVSLKGLGLPQKRVNLTHGLLREKMLTVFFKMSRSRLTISNSRLSRR